MGGFGRKLSFKPQGALRLLLTVAEKPPNVIQRSRTVAAPLFSVGSVAVKSSPGGVRGEVTGKDLLGVVWEAA